MSLKKQLSNGIYILLARRLAGSSVGTVKPPSSRYPSGRAAEQSSRPKNIYLENWSCILIQGGQTGCFCCLKYLKDVTVHQ